MLRRPLRCVDVEVTSVDGYRLGRELVADARIAEGVHAHADSRPVGFHVAPEDLADADLSRAVGLVLVANHPQGHHTVRVVGGPGPHFDPAVVRSVQPDVLLGLAHYGDRREAVLPDRTTDRTSEDAGLQRRDAHLAVELRAP